MTIRPQAVIFDCDGVLADSEPHSVAAWLGVLKGLGHPAGEVDVESCTGLGFGPTWEHLSAIAPLPPQSQVWSQLLAGLERRFIDPGLHRFADAAAILNRCLAEGVAVAVVSASPRQRLDLTLKYAGLEGVFPVSVSGDDVERGKPAPDPYLVSMTQLGASPARCVVIEDSSAGTESAIAAGTRVVAVVRDEMHRAPLEATGVTVVDWLSAETVGL